MGSSGGGERVAPSMPPAQQPEYSPQYAQKEEVAPAPPQYAQEVEVAPAPAPAPRLEQKRKAPGGDGRQPVWGAPELPQQLLGSRTGGLLFGPGHGARAVDNNRDRNCLALRCCDRGKRVELHQHIQLATLATSRWSCGNHAQAGVIIVGWH